MREKLFNLAFILLGFVVVGTAVYTAAKPSFFTRSVFAAPAVDYFAYLPLVTKPAQGIQPPAGMIYIDHNSVASFDQIPARYVQAAADIDMIFIDRSVGGNINNGLNCLSNVWDAAPSNCKRYEHPADPAFNAPISEVSWSGSYDNANWDFLFWPNAGQGAPEISCAASTGEWQGKLECFLEFAQNQANNYDVLTFQYSYLSVDDHSSIADSTSGFLLTTPAVTTFTIWKHLKRSIRIKL